MIGHFRTDLHPEKNHFTNLLSTSSTECFLKNVCNSSANLLKKTYTHSRRQLPDSKPKYESRARTWRDRAVRCCTNENYVNMYGISKMCKNGDVLLRYYHVFLTLCTEWKTKYPNHLSYWPININH